MKVDLNIKGIPTFEGLERSHDWNIGKDSNVDNMNVDEDVNVDNNDRKAIVITWLRV